MKKLQKLTLKELGESIKVIDQSVAIRLKGGDGEQEYYERYGVSLPEGNSYNPVCDMVYSDSWGNAMDSLSQPPDTNVSTCPRCELNKQYGIVSDPIYGSENQRFWINTAREFFANTLPHMLGVGGHVNGSN
jgi:hypothetical protein